MVSKRTKKTSKNENIKIAKAILAETKKDPVLFGKTFIRREIHGKTQSWQAHEAQARIMRTDAKIYTISAGRRFGKTEMMAVLAIYHAIFGEGDVLILAPTYKQSMIMFKKISHFLQTAWLISDLVESQRKNPTPEITFRNGNSIHALSTYDPEKLRGLGANVVILDEAAYISDNVVEEVVVPMLLDTDGKLYKISTPFPGVKNHFYRTFKAGVEDTTGRYASFRFPSYANPYISKEALEDIKKKLGENSLAWKVEIEAMFVASGGMLFSYDLLRSLQREYKLYNPNGKYVMGVDFARANDYNAVVVLDVSTKPWKVVYLARWHVNKWLENIEKVIKIAGNFPNVRIVCDATGAGAPLYELLKTRYKNVVGVQIVHLVKRDLIAALKLAIERGEIIFPKEDVLPEVSELINELMYFEYTFNAAGRLSMHAQRGRNDDYVMALSLVVYNLTGTVGDSMKTKRVVLRKEYDNFTWNIKF